mmetsp:Transcript_14647/g.36471  ORF Transcript_14647/g.36471 Transcript_14647/m.36471 type:complete len:237 (-) Transcript_14647:1484-2194(-)
MSWPAAGVTRWAGWCRCGRRQLPGSWWRMPRARATPPMAGRPTPTATGMRWAGCAWPWEVLGSRPRAARRPQTRWVACAWVMPPSAPTSPSPVMQAKWLARVQARRWNACCWVWRCRQPARPRTSRSSTRWRTTACLGCASRGAPRTWRPRPARATPLAARCRRWRWACSRCRRPRTGSPWCRSWRPGWGRWAAGGAGAGWPRRSSSPRPPRRWRWCWPHARWRCTTTLPAPRSPT